MGRIKIERSTIELELPLALLQRIDSARGAIPRNFFICGILKKVLKGQKTCNGSHGTDDVLGEG